MSPSTSQIPSIAAGFQPNPRFPPAPPASPPPTLPYPIPPRLASPPCSPTLPCPPTQAASPSTPSIPSSQPRHAGTPHMTSPGGNTTDEVRTYGFDLNPHWQEDKDHFDNQKINGLTFPRTIRPSAFTQKLDIEGCDPLKLPLAALLYQQANNFWLRKLAHGRELYLIPTGDIIAAVVFMTELLTQLRNKGVDLDKVSSSKARQDGKFLDKTNNTKYAAQQIADLIHSWVPTRSADPDTQHELTQLRSQLAQLRQQLGDDSAAPSTPGPTGPSASSPRCNAYPGRSPEKIQQSSTSCVTQLRSLLPVGRHDHPQSVACSTYANNSCWSSVQQMAQRTPTIGSKEKGSHGQHCQNRDEWP